jgi:hypothetical protein
MARRGGATQLMEAWPADLPWLRASPMRTRASVGCEQRRLEHQFLVTRIEGNRCMRDDVSITGLIIDVTW